MVHYSLIDMANYFIVGLCKPVPEWRGQLCRNRTFTATGIKLYNIILASSNPELCMCIMNGALIIHFKAMIK